MNNNEAYKPNIKKDTSLSDIIMITKPNKEIAIGFNKSLKMITITIMIAVILNYTKRILLYNIMVPLIFLLLLFKTIFLYVLIP